MNLLKNKWIPCIRNGMRSAESIASISDFKPYQIDVGGRPELNFSILMMLVGQKATGSIDNTTLYSSDESEDRFMQNKAALNGNEKPIRLLLLDQPGESTVKNNKDHFVKNGSVSGICPCCVIPALYCKNQFSGPSGQGYYPGSMYHAVNYLIERETVAETVQANIISVAHKSVYFSRNADYWLSAPVLGECDICGNHGDVFTTYWVKSSGSAPEIGNTFHQAKSNTGKLFVVHPGQGLPHIMNGVATDADIEKIPEVIARNAHNEDKLIAFAAFYDKASLRKIHYARFQRKNLIDINIFNKLFSLVFNNNNNKKAELSDIHTTLYAELYSAFSENVIDKTMTEAEAVIDIYDKYYTPAVDVLNLDHLNRWVANRKLLIAYLKGFLK